MSNADPQRPTTWHRYTKGLCDGCWSGCCTLPLETSAADLIRLGLVEEAEASFSLRDVAKRLQKEKIIQSYNPKSGIFVIAQRSGRDCIFLDEKTRLCTVYERRPEVCRQFPKIGPRPGFCPATKKARS